MPRLNIPDRYRLGLSTILSLDQQTFDGLVSVLERMPPTVGLPLRQSGLSVSGLEPNKLDSILLSIGSVYVVWSANAELSLDAFVNDLTDAIASFDPAGTSEEAKVRLRRLLGIEALASSSKAQAVLVDHDHTFYEAKVLTDLRCAFRSDPDAEPYGAVIVHKLKLAYHEGGEHKQFFVALDGDDVARLKAVLDRAQAKARALKKKLAAAEVRYLGKGDE